MKFTKANIVIIGVIALVLILGAVVEYRNRSAGEVYQQITVQGEVLGSSAEAGVFRVERSDNTIIAVAVASTTEFRDETGQKIGKIYPGLKVEVKGRETSPLTFVASEIRVTQGYEGYRNPDFGISVGYPYGWLPDKMYTSASGRWPLKFLGKHGYFGIDAVGNVENIKAAGDKIVDAKDRPYGTSPKGTPITIAGQDAMAIVPDADQPDATLGQGAVVVKLPEAAKVNGSEFQYIVLYGSIDYIEGITGTLSFATGTASVLE